MHRTDETKNKQTKYLNTAQLHWNIGASLAFRKLPDVEIAKERKWTSNNVRKIFWKALIEYLKHSSCVLSNSWYVKNSHQLTIIYLMAGKLCASMSHANVVRNSC